MDQKENIIIFGAGRVFKNNIVRWSEFFNIIALTDNGNIGNSYGLNCILPTDITTLDFDKILITPVKFFEEIKKQILVMGIEEQKIVDCKSLHEEMNELKFVRDVKEYSEKFLRNKNKKLQVNFGIDFNLLHPCKNEWWQDAGCPESYFWQDLWGAKKVITSGVKQHIDIGSRLDGFIVHLLATGIEVTMLDVRPLETTIPDLKFIQTDATNLENIKDNSIESLSALCSIEHFGLGRYNDPIDPDACFKAFKAIQRVMKKNGRVYISLPVSKKECLRFNAHRTFLPETVLEVFDEMCLIEFSVIYEKNKENVIKTFNKIADFDEEMEVMGLFIFEKK